MPDHPQSTPEPVESQPSALTPMGVSLSAGDEVTVGGDVVGRDKITNNIQNIVQRALTAVEAAEQEQSFEARQLAQGVSSFLQQLQARVDEALDASRTGNPYKGLLEYRLSDADLFFGREKATRDLLGHLSRGPLTLLHAEAGAGKTSLLQARISPRLIIAGHLPLYLRPLHVEPSFAIKRMFISDPSQTPLLATAPVRDFLRHVCDVLGPATTLYILLDQFEEFFTQPADPGRDNFIRELAECLDDESLNVRWLLALRTEYFGHLANFRPRIRNPFENDYRLNRLTRPEADEVIRKPAERRGIMFEDGLIDTLLDDLGKSEIAPPQLQLVCSALFDELEPGQAVITRALYERAGGAAGILRDYLDSVLTRNLSSADRETAWQLLAAVTDQPGGSSPEASLLARLKTHDVAGAQTRRVLSLLEANQLLRLSDERYELTSDSLLPRIRQWATTRAVFEQAKAEGVRQLDRIRGSALRGLLGGALGFSLAYWIAHSAQNKPFLGYRAFLRAWPGACAGILLILFVDVALASYHGPRRWLRWMAGGLAGAMTVALAMLFDALLRSSILDLDPLALARATLEGALWGLATGLGMVWAMSDGRPKWLTVPLVVIACAATLWLAEGVGRAFAAPPLLDLLAAGAIMPFCVITAGLLGQAREAKVAA